MARGHRVHLTTGGRGGGGWQARIVVGVVVCAWCAGTGSSGDPVGTRIVPILVATWHSCVCDAGANGQVRCASANG